MERKIRKATLRDAESISELVWYYAKDALMLARPVEYINPRIKDFFVWVNGEEIIGCIALRIWDGEWAEILALAVTEEHKGQGAGIELINSCLAEAKTLGVKHIVMFTFNGQLAAKAGFSKIDISILPKIIFTEKTVIVDKAYAMEINDGSSY